VFTSSSFNNRFEHESSLFEPISSKLTSSSARLHPYLPPNFHFPPSFSLPQILSRGVIVVHQVYNNHYSSFPPPSPTKQRRSPPSSVAAAASSAIQCLHPPPCSAASHQPADLSQPYAVWSPPPTERRPPTTTPPVCFSFDSFLFFGFTHLGFAWVHQVCFWGGYIESYK